MKTPYERPWPALLFYILAVLYFLICAFIGVSFVVGGGVPTSLKYPGMGAAMATSGLGMICIGVISAAFISAIGYIIEIIAKIEWNTRADESPAWSYVPPGAPNPVPTKRYFYIANGPLHGPFQAPEILDLYRSGKVPNNARLYVEEAGNRRPLVNWSEIGV